MSHHIYHTKGLIVAKKDRGEADLYLKIFTPDLGMVLATAQGARKIGSKSRYALGLYMLPDIDLIKTKDSFRVGAARPEPARPPRSQILMRAKISALLNKFFTERDEAVLLFEKIQNLLENPDKDSDVFGSIYILNFLGYWSQKIDFNFNQQLDQKQRASLVREINKTISHIQT